MSKPITSAHFKLRPKDAPYFREEIFISMLDAQRIGLNDSGEFCIFSIEPLFPGPKEEEYAVHVVVERNMETGTIFANHEFLNWIGFRPDDERLWSVKRAASVVPVQEAVIESVVDQGNVNNEIENLRRQRKDLFSQRCILIEPGQRGSELQLPMKDRAYFYLRSVRSIQPPPEVIKSKIILVFDENTALNLFVPHRKSGVDMVIVVDASGSMDLSDYAGSDGRPKPRLEGVKKALEILIQRKLTSGSRVSSIAIIAFGENTRMLYPKQDGMMVELKNDNQITEILASIRFLSRIGLERLKVERTQTNISGALRYATELLDYYAQEGNEKMLILMSDGADWVEVSEDKSDGEVVGTLNDPAVLADSLRFDNKVRIHTVSISDEEALRKYEDRRYWDQGWAIPNTRLLQKIADHAEGLFIKSPDASSLAKLFDELGEGAIYPLISGDFPEQSEAYIDISEEIVEPYSFQELRFNNLELNLPPKNYTFVGREEEIQKLIAEMYSQSPQIISITGLGGIGKTALACEVAERSIYMGLFNHIIWESFDSSTSKNKFAKEKTNLQVFEQLMDTILEYFDQTDKTGLTLDKKRTKIKRLLEDNQCLIILDAVDNIELCEYFVDMLYEFIENCCIILTSRQRFTLKRSMYQIDLSSMTENDFWHFLREEEFQLGVDIFNQPESSLRKIYLRTGGMPFILKLAVVQLQSLSIDEVLENLNFYDDKTLFYLYYNAWRSLSAEGRRTLTHIARIASSDISLSIPELIETGIEEMNNLQIALDELYLKSLLEIENDVQQNQNQRYHIHPATRYFINSNISKRWEEESKVNSNQIECKLLTKEIFKNDQVDIIIELTNCGKKQVNDIICNVIDGPGYSLRHWECERSIKELPPQSSKSLKYTIKPKKSTAIIHFKIAYIDQVNNQEMKIEFNDRVKFVEYRGGFQRIEPIPYVAGVPIDPDKNARFVGRLDIIDWVENQLQEQQRPILILYGQRRTGKTSTLLQLERGSRGENIRKGLDRRVYPVYVDLQKLTDHGTDNFLSGICMAISSTLGKRGIKCTIPSDKCFSRACYSTFNRFLDKLNITSDSGLIVLMFDEFEELEKRVVDNKVDRDIFSQLRSQMQHRENLSFILAGSHRLDDMSSDYQNIIFNIARHREITFLNKEETIELIREPVKSRVQFEDLAVEKLWLATNGHPYFIQLLCYEVISKMNNRAERNYVTGPDISEAIEGIVSEGGRELEYLWDQSTKDEKIVLTVMSELEKYARFFDISRRIKSSEISDISDKHILAALESLIKRRMVERKPWPNTDDNPVFSYCFELLGEWTYRKKRVASLRISFSADEIS